MTVDDVFQALRDRGAVLMLQDGGLRYIGPARLAPDDPIRAGIGEHRAMLIELFTYAPGGRCVAPGCYRLKIDGQVTCPDHAETTVSEINEPCRNENGVCQDSTHERFAFDDYFDERPPSRTTGTSSTA